MYYFKQVKGEQIVSVEAKSVNVASPNFIKATGAECNGFIALLPTPTPPKPPRNLVAEIDDLKERLVSLETR